MLQVSVDVKLSDETGSSFDQIWVIGSDRDRNRKIFKMADLGPTVGVGDGQKWFLYSFFELIP